jgi:hypothetical protein
MFSVVSFIKSQLAPKKLEPAKLMYTQNVTVSDEVLSRQVTDRAIVDITICVLIFILLTATIIFCVVRNGRTNDRIKHRHLV